MQRGEIGKRLRRLRICRQKTQQWIADRVRVERKTISRYENGGGIDADLADEVLKLLGGIHVLGANLTADESREVAKLIADMRKERLRKEREKQNAVFQKYQKKEEGSRGNR